MIALGRYKSLFWVIILLFGFYKIQAQAIPDSLRNDSLQKKLDTLTIPQAESHFTPEYERILDKADQAFKFGLYKRAARFYKEAEKINPNSIYIQYRLKEIENLGSNFRNFLFYFNFEKPDLLIRSLTFLVLYFMASMLIILLFILIHRNRMTAEEKRKQTLREKYQALLVDYLFTTDNASNVPKEIRKIASSSYSRKILIDQMIDLSINLSGDTKDKLRDLFFALKLEQDSIRKVYNRKWHIKVKGFRELAFMDIVESNDQIIRCLRSKNDIIRMEAQLAMVRLSHGDAFGFLDHLEKPFTLWEQLTVYETIMYHNLPVPNFDRWLFSKNKTVVMFALRMIDIFKQRETYPNLFWMLVNEDPEIRNLTIRTIGNLKLKEAAPHLKRIYKNETYQNCLAIIQAIAKIPNEKTLNFLKLVIDKEEDVQLQIEAAMAIHNLGDVGKAELQKMMDSDYKNYQIIIKHVLDKRIN
jgi:FOG: HEAT repeat